MNKELLFKLYSIHSESGREKKMRRFLRKVAEECGATSVETDTHGNLLIVKGEAKTYPCLAAHMDQVQRQHSSDFTVVEVNGDAIGYSAKSHEQQGLGADDKNGIFICLELLRRFDAMKVAFFVGEEVGCVGSSAVDLQFFKDCRFIIEPDRRGSSDLITSMYCGKVCSDKFIEAIGYEDFGYKQANGTVTDVGTLTERGVGVSCLNLSCGYYNAHSSEEITVLDELENCLNFVEHIVETCEEVFPFTGGYGAYGRNYGHYGLYYYEDSYGGYGYFNGKKYDGAKKSSGLSTGSGTARHGYAGSARYDSVDDYDYEYDYYYSGGYYDADCELMEQYLQIQPDLTFDIIKSCYMDDFNVGLFFDIYDAEDVLREIYFDKKSDYHYDDEYWDEGGDAAPIDEVISELRTLKKVS